MCGFCTAAELEKQCDDDGLGTVQANWDEIANTIPGDTSTLETITVGGFREETLEVAGDEDWFRITLEAGDAIQIDLVGVDHDAGNGLGDLEDPLLRLYDGNGNFLGQNDDRSFFSTDSRLTFTADVSGDYYIAADSYNGLYAGDYRIDVIEVVPEPPVLPLEAIEGATSLNDEDPILVYFAEAGDSYTYAGDEYIATGTNAYEQDQLWSIFTGVEEFTALDFEITTNQNAADLEWATATLPSTSGGTLLGFFNFPDGAGDGGFGVLNDNDSAFPNWNDTPGGTLDVGGFMYGVAIHELGHGLGMGHPHDTGNGTDVMEGVAGSGDRGDYNLNSAAYTAMSYNEGSVIAGVASSTASTGHGATYGALDMAALQNMYGANNTFASGDDTYTLQDSNTTGSGTGYYATWDTGGTDEIVYTGTKDATIDLREATLQNDEGGGGYLSYVDGVIGGRTIANGVDIENASTGEGADTIMGNESDNILDSGRGWDTISGEGGNDKLFGDAGSDNLEGGYGRDTLDGGSGSDTLDGGGGNDRLRGGSGSDVMDGGGGNDFVDYRSSNAAVTVDIETNIVSGGYANGDVISNFERISGSKFGDDLTGSSKANRLLGKDGNDTLNGAGNDDLLKGGAGDDTFLFMTGDGNDDIQGGADNDVYDFLAFESSAFNVVDLAGADWTITEISTGDVDSVTSVETLRFADIDMFA